MLPMFDILKAVFVRSLLIIHALVAVWRVTESYQNNIYWILACILVLLFAESLYTIIKRRGKEYQRFMPAFFCYLCTVLTCIWLLELDKTEKFLVEKTDSQGCLEEEKKNVTNITNEFLPVPLTPNTWIMLVEEMLPYFLFVSRWILPRGEVKREQLAELLFAFIGIGGDIMEYFSLLGEEAVRSNINLCYVVLAIWSFSVLQFTMTITVIHQPKRQRNINVVVENGDPSAHKKLQKFRHEVSAIFLTMIMQDLPFLIVRLYVMIGFNAINYSLIFFTSKNIMIISLLFYKLAIICTAYYRPKKPGEGDDDEDEDDEDEEDDTQRPKRKRNKAQIYAQQNGGKPEVGNHIYETETETGVDQPNANKRKSKSNKKTMPGDQFVNPFPEGKLIVSDNGLAISPYLIENPSFQHSPRRSMTTRSTNTSPEMFRAALKGYIEIGHTTPRGDESHDTGFTSDNQDRSRSHSGSRRSSYGSRKFTFSDPSSIYSDIEHKES